MENTSKDMRTEFNELKSEFTFVLRKYLFLPDRKLPDQKTFYDTKELRTFLIENKKRRKVVAINPKYIAPDYLDLKDLEKTRKNYESKEIEENANTKLIHASISCLIKLQSEEKITITDLLNAYDKVLVALDCLEQSIKEEESLIDEKKDWVRNKYNELKDEVFGTVTVDDSNNNLVKKDLQENVVSLICCDPAILKKIHSYSTFNKILLTITEKKSNNEKIKSYIDDAFVFLLLVFFRERTSEKGISFKKWMKTVIENVLANITKDPKLVLVSQEYNNLENTEEQKTLAGYLWRRDIQFWFEIINLENRKDNKRAENMKSWNLDIDDAIPDYLTMELCQYRNMAAHSSGNAVDLSWLLRTLQAMISFTKKLGKTVEEWNIETSLLEKRFYFEIYNNDRIHRGKTPIKRYGDVMYNRLKYIEAPIPSWKNILKIKNVEDVPYPIDETKKSPLEHAKAVVQYFFEDLTDEENRIKDDTIKQIKEFYTRNRLLFPFFINGTGFTKLIEEGYPFNPMFFVLTRNLSLWTVLEIAEECIKNAVNSDEMHPMILPSDINYLGAYEMKNTILEYYSTGKIMKSGFYKELSTSYFSDLEKNFEIIKNAIEKNMELNSYAYNSVWKSIAILSIDEMKKTYNDSPSRDWIRLCSCQPGDPIHDIEISMELITVNNLFSLPDNPFQLISPLNYKDKIESVFSFVRSPSNPFTFSEESRNNLAIKYTEMYKERYPENFGPFPGLCDIVDSGREELRHIINDSEEKNEYKKVLSRLSPEETSVLCNLLEKIEKVDFTSIPFISIGQEFSEEEINCLAKLNGECLAEDYKNETALQWQVLQYTKIVWDYYKQTS